MKLIQLTKPSTMVNILINIHFPVIKHTIRYALLIQIILNKHILIVVKLVRIHEMETLIIYIQNQKRYVM